MSKSDEPSVTIHNEKIKEFVRALEKKVEKDGIAYEPWAKYHIDPNSYSLEQVLSYTFVVDAMNFCFWPGNPAGNFESEHMTKNLAKILDSSPDFFKPEKLAEVTAAFLKTEVFNNMEFALLEERARIVREVGTVVSHYYEGSFLKYLERAGFDAVKLVR